MTLTQLVRSLIEGGKVSISSRQFALLTIVIVGVMAVGYSGARAQIDATIEERVGEIDARSKERRAESARAEADNRARTFAACTASNRARRNVDRQSAALRRLALSLDRPKIARDFQPVGQVDCRRLVAEAEPPLPPRSGS